MAFKLLLPVTGSFDLLNSKGKVENTCRKIQTPIMIVCIFQRRIIVCCQRDVSFLFPFLCLRTSSLEKFIFLFFPGAYVHGLYMEGARWDMQTGMINEARLKDLAPAMPVIFLKAIPVDRQDMRNIYECPVYKTKQRGPTFVWTFNLKSKEKPSKWILGGVALLLQV